MITLKEFMETVNYRITEGGEYGWQCFGSTAYSLSSWNGDHDGWSFNVVFDTEYQTVYVVEACDYARNRAYRLIHPDCVEDYREEAKERNVPENEAWDDVNYVDLESVEDFLEKARAIVAGEDYDTRVIIPLNLSDDVLFALMQQAHEADITLNQHFENIIKQEIRRVAEERDNKELIESLENSFDDFPVDKKAGKMKSKKKGKK